MDESLVGSPGFKPVREALTLSWVGSIPTRLRHPWSRKFFLSSSVQILPFKPTPVTLPGKPLGDVSTA